MIISCHMEDGWFSLQPKSILHEGKFASKFVAEKRVIISKGGIDSFTFTQS